MKLIILQENISDLLKSAAPFVLAQAHIPQLESFLLEAKDSKLSVSASSLAVSIKKTARAKVLKNGKVCINSKNILSFINQLPPGKVEMEEKENKIFIKTKQSEAEFNTTTSEGFPEIEKGKEGIKIKAETIKQIAKKITPSAAQDETRVVLTGIKIEKRDEKTRAVATDGFRLAIGELKENILKNEGESIIIPAKLIEELARLTDKKQEISLSFNRQGGKIIFSFENAIINAQLIEGEYPDFEKIIPTGFTTKAIIDKELFNREIKTASIFAKNSANIVRLNFQKEELSISANSPQVGKNRSVLPAKLEGKEIKIAFNYRFLVDFFKSTDAQEIIFEASDPLKPGVFKPKGDLSYFHIIMPVRVQDENSFKS